MKKPVQTSLGFFVIFLHVVVLVFALQKKDTVSLKRRPLVVHTKVFIPPKKSPPVKPVSNPKPRPKRKPRPKHVTKKRVVKKTAPVKKIPQNLLDQLEESIAKIHENTDKEYRQNRTPARKGAAPKLLGTSIKLATIAPEARDYQSKLIACLHEALHLPEHGEVKVELTMSSDGKLLRLNVLRAESKKNKTYLEKQLHHVSFPRISDRSSSKKEHTFVLSFTHEI